MCIFLTHYIQNVISTGNHFSHKVYILQHTTQFAQVTFQELSACGQRLPPLDTAALDAILPIKSWSEDGNVLLYAFGHHLLSARACAKCFIGFMPAHRLVNKVLGLSRQGGCWESTDTTSPWSIATVSMPRGPRRKNWVTSLS